MSKFLTLDDLIAQGRLNKGKDIIDQLLPDSGYMIIGGETGAGKTNDALHLLCALASGGTYHGLSVKTCQAVYINLEDNASKIGERLAVIRPQYQVVFEPLVRMDISSLCLDRTAGVEALRTIITEASNQSSQPVKVVILDNLKYTFAGDYMNPSNAKSWADNLIRLSKEMGVAFVVLHHTRKMVYYQNGDVEDLASSDRFKGAKDLIDHAEAAVLFAATNKVKWLNGKSTRIKSDDNLFVVKHRHCNTSPGLKEYPLPLHFDANRLCWNGARWLIHERTVSIIKTGAQGDENG